MVTLAGATAPGEGPSGSVLDLACVLRVDWRTFVELSGNVDGSCCGVTRALRAGIVMTGSLGAVAGVLSLISNCFTYRIWRSCRPYLVVSFYALRGWKAAPGTRFLQNSLDRPTWPNSSQRYCQSTQVQDARTHVILKWCTQPRQMAGSLHR